MCGYSCELRSLGANVKTTENSGTKVTKLEFSMGLDNIIKRFGVDLVGCFSVYKGFGRFVMNEKFRDLFCKIEEATIGEDRELSDEA